MRILLCSALAAWLGTVAVDLRVRPITCRPQDSSASSMAKTWGAGKGW